MPKQGSLVGSHMIDTSNPKSTFTEYINHQSHNIEMRIFFLFLLSIFGGVNSYLWVHVSSPNKIKKKMVNVRWPWLRHIKIPVKGVHLETQLARLSISDQSSYRSSAFLIPYPSPRPFTTEEEVEEQYWNSEPIVPHSTKRSRNMPLSVRSLSFIHTRKCRQPRANPIFMI